MAIALRAVNTPLNGNTGSTFTCAAISTAAIGDLLLIVFSGFSSSGVVNPLSPPAGWTTLVHQEGTTTSEHVALFYRIATSSDVSPSTPTYAVTSTTSFTRWTCDIIAYSGVDTATPFDGVTPTVLSVAQGAFPGAVYTATGLTTLSANDWLVSYIAQTTSGLLTISGIPSSFNRRWENDASVQNGGPNSVGSYADGVQVAAGATGTISWTSSGDRDTFVLLAALRPLVAGVLVVPLRSLMGVGS